MAPKFKHDCAVCTYLGTFEDADLYYCPQHGLPTLIVRRSSVASDYNSMLAEIVRRDHTAFSEYMPALTEALKRAKERRLALGGGAIQA